MRSHLLVVCLAACVPHEIDGTPDDVHTMPGSFDHFRFVLPCSDGNAQQAVIGDGSMILGDGPPSLARDRKLEEAGDALYKAIHSKVPSMFNAGGASSSCEGGSRAATWLELWDWRDVDAAVPLVGDWLREHDMGMEVGILVTRPDGM